ncbi:hypothetical protein JAAARDRAFT_58224 [Jaapia argillacea MUCL 33604]|uniref:Uncharacterized protein n=1 Tax=Jaapia argillacea MUCL 33604 TaxID=933084 RepID=A0A067Q2B8_9AGAM|nr:hypothetical protein JAAARDRAFT_58224 [Jaapia argillacea MUCL 33604]
MATKEKLPHFKGPSRVEKMCHWCKKKQQPDMPNFQACGRCKEGPCKVNADAKKSVSQVGGDVTQKIATFKKWHALQVDLLRQAFICALDLAHAPSAVEDHCIMLRLEQKANASLLPPADKYEPTIGMVLTNDEAIDILNQIGDGKGVMESGKASHEHMKRKGGLGVATLLLEAHGMIDVTRIVLPSLDGARKIQRMDDWGTEHWVEKLKERLDMAADGKSVKFQFTK